MIWILLLVGVPAAGLLLALALMPARPDSQIANLIRERAKTTPDSQLPELSAEYPAMVEVLVEWVDRAVRDADWPEVIRRAEILRDRFPDHPAGYANGARGLMRTKNVQAAEALILNAQRVFHQNYQLVFQYALCAEEVQDWPEAWRRWKMVQQGFPNDAAGLMRGGVVLTRLERWDEVESTFAQLFEGFPAHWEGALRYAQLAHRRGDWSEADRRWTIIRTRFDSRPEGYLHGSEALRKLGRPEEAAQVIATGAFLFPKHKVLGKHHVPSRPSGTVGPKVAARTTTLGKPAAADRKGPSVSAASREL